MSTALNNFAVFVIFADFAVFVIFRRFVKGSPPTKFALLCRFSSTASQNFAVFVIFADFAVFVIFVVSSRALLDLIFISSSIFVNSLAKFRCFRYFRRFCSFVNFCRVVEGSLRTLFSFLRRYLLRASQNFAAFVIFADFAVFADIFVSFVTAFNPGHISHYQGKCPKSANFTCKYLHYTCISVKSSEIRLILEVFLRLFDSKQNVRSEAFIRG